MNPPILQLLIDTSISANWILLIMAAVVGFFFVRTLNRIEKNSEEHTKQIAEITRWQQEYHHRLKKVEEDIDGEELAEKLIAKIRAITPK